MFACICELEFKTPEDLIGHIKECHNNEVNGGSTRSPNVRKCRVCEVSSTNFDRYQRTCRICASNKLSRCTGCNKPKPVDQFYKGNIYGQCIVCRRGREDHIPRSRGGFSNLPEKTQEGIRKRLAKLREWIESNGTRGRRYTFAYIARKYGILESTLHIWVRSGKIDPWFERRWEKKEETNEN